MVLKIKPQHKQFNLRVGKAGLPPLLNFMNFVESSQYLLSLGHETLAMKLGLRNTELLLERLGQPQASYEVVQIAGTNGKGSTAVMLDSICRAAGISTGLYTSPHLISITERISINGSSISKETFATLATEVRAAADDLLKGGRIEALPTFFEHLTAIALLAFRAGDVNLVILETGLGGRLDATTVAGAKTVAITPIALDHQEYLGETVASIAAEKAAIIHSGVTAIIAPQTSAARDVIMKRCDECGVVPILETGEYKKVSTTSDGRLAVTFETDADHYQDVKLGLRGRHQLQNAALAVRLAESLRNRGFRIPKAAIINGLETAQHFGRLSSFGGSMLLDGAHNPAAARALRNYLDEFVAAPLTLIFGAMRDKQLDEMAQILFPQAEHLVLTQPNNIRAATVDSLLAVAKKHIVSERILVAPRVSNALETARRITSAGGTICVTGSLYLIGEACAELEKRQKVD
ncbi:MAG TPA: Mur ligase family protein [Pyrinomonadaceae bacterium]|nr:Mur ligase family protein [Pyrinomonadaceae bacterium]